jgi:hypothetical protein
MVIIPPRKSFAQQLRANRAEPGGVIVVPLSKHRERPYHGRQVKALGEGQEPDAPGDVSRDGRVGVSLDRQVERQKQEDEPSRAEAIRRLVEQALKTKAK